MLTAAPRGRGPGLSQVQEPTNSSLLCFPLSFSCVIEGGGVSAEGRGGFNLLIALSTTVRGYGGANLTQAVVTLVVAASLPSAAG